MSTFKKKIRFPPLVNNSVQNYNIRSVTKNVLMGKKTNKTLAALKLFPGSYKKYSKI